MRILIDFDNNSDSAKGFDALCGAFLLEFGKKIVKYIRKCLQISKSVVYCYNRIVVACAGYLQCMERRAEP